MARSPDPRSPAKVLVLGGTPSDDSIVDALPAHAGVLWQSFCRPGFGRAPVRPRRFGDVAAMVDVSDVDAFVGVSGGGPQALFLASTRPGSRVLVICGMPPRRHFDRYLDQCVHEALFRSLADGVAPFFEAMRRARDYAAIVGSCAGPVADVERGIFEELRALYEDWDVDTTALEAIWIHPRDDRNAPPGAVRDYIAGKPNIALREVDGGHSISLETLLTPELVRWLTFESAQRPR
jgi:hypothetical protein